jgi:hypothetical protein
MSSLIPLLAASTPPASGAAIGQVIIATGAAMVAMAGLLYLGVGHTTGRVKVLGRMAATAERVSGIPGWAALPAGLIAGSLIVALFGMMWDISLHIDDGRDPGPLANPAHYFILAGLFGIFASGFIAIVLPRERPSRTAVRLVGIGGDWYAPLGGLLIASCGLFALVGFPLDDMWHRLFGQDVTLWGPTHLMLIGGAAMTLLGLAVLLVEAGRASTESDAPTAPTRFFRLLQSISLPGGLLLGMSTFQGEFDFGVPQFHFVFQPMLIALAAGTTLVAARIWLGRGAALGAVGFFLAVRGVIALLVGPVLGEATPHFPLYVAEALCVELIALRVSPQRPIAFGLWSGVAIGTVGLAAEWGWSYVFMPTAWPSSLLLQAAILGPAMAIAGSLLGAWIGARLAAESMPRTPSLRRVAVLSAVAVAAMVGYGLYQGSSPNVTAHVKLATAHPAPGRTVDATIRLDPADAADDAQWLNLTAWQGGGLVLDHLDEVAPGTYRTTEPIPVHGDWKALVRLSDSSTLTAIPVYLPADPAIPVDGVPAKSSFTRTFVSDHEILQREQQGASSWLWALAYSVIGGIALGFLALIAWGIHRVAVTARPEEVRAATRPRRVSPPVHREVLE